jgi:hypothetical protein
MLANTDGRVTWRVVLLALLPFISGACGASADSGTDDRDGQQTLVHPVAPLPFPLPGATLVPLVSGVHVTAGDDRVQVVYTRGAAAPASLQVRLVGPAGPTVLPERPLAQATGARFTGLDSCTAYHYTIETTGQSAVLSGDIHTLQGGICPDRETLGPNEWDWFTGEYHWHDDHPWCQTSDRSFAFRQDPVGQPWWHVKIAVQQPPATLGPLSVSVGYDHYWEPGADPFPCSEQFIRADRARLTWQIGAARLRRMQSATVRAKLTSPQLCVTDFARVDRSIWSVTAAMSTAVSDDGTSWADELGYNNGTAVERMASIAPLALSGTDVSAVVTGPLRDGNGYISGGFVANDGFPIPTGYESYPRDNDSCGTGLDMVGLDLAYTPLHPDTPLNCSAVLFCEQFTVTCDAAPETFEVHQNIAGVDRVVASAGGTAAAAPRVAGTRLAPVPFSVCTVAGGVRACTDEVPITSTTTCSSGGGAVGPPGGPRCGGAGRPCQVQ